jgi:Flp pilus assembly secretin CpaC
MHSLFTRFGFYFLALSGSGLLFNPAAWCETTTGAPIYLEQGEQRILPFSHIERYSLNGSDIIHYVRLPGQDTLLVKALKPGLATLYVSTSGDDSETHEIRVDAKKASFFPQPLLNALNLVKTSEVIDGGDRYLLRGVVKTASEARAIANLKERFPTFILDETTRPSADLEREVQTLKKILAPHTGLYLEATDGTLCVHGGVASASQKESIVKQIHAIDPLVVIDIQNLKDSDPTLVFKVYLLEVKKELITNLGVEWPPTHPASFNLDSGAFTASGTIDLTLHTLEQQNLVHILSSPELVVKAPGQAELFAGTEFPIRERSTYSDNVIWKNIGLSLKLDVKEYGGEKVRLSVETEMSHIDTNLTNDQVPAIQTNRIKTLVDGTIGKPLLLSGLLQEDLRSTQIGLPGLSSIPIIGKLFSSEDYQNSRSEFVAILVPQRNLPAHPMQRISRNFPKGYLPAPRNYVSEEEKENLKKSDQYPWNSI